MIIRILAEGLYEFPDGEGAALEQLDQDLESAIDRGDQEQLDQALGALLTQVRSRGRALPPEDLRPSDLVLPHEGSTVEELRSLLAEGRALAEGHAEP